MVSRQPVLRRQHHFLLNLQKTTGNALPVVFHFGRDRRHLRPTPGCSGLH